MYKIETIRVTKWFASIPAWIVSTANGVCITIFEIKSIMKAQICHMIQFYLFLTFANTENCIG